MMMEGIQIIDVPVHWVNEGEKRLDAGFYAQDVIAARILIEKVSKHLDIQSIRDFSNQIFGLVGSRDIMSLKKMENHF